MNLRINLGKIYEYLRIVMILYLLVLILLCHLVPLDDNTGELYLSSLMILISLIILREIFKSYRFCGVGDMLLFYGNSSKITWEADIKNGLVDHIYYWFSDSSFKYELDYKRCKMHRRCGYNEYHDFITEAGETCIEYRELLTKKYSGEYYENIKRDRYRGIVFRLILLSIISICLYNFIMRYVY